MYQNAIEDVFSPYYAAAVFLFYAGPVFTAAWWNWKMEMVVTTP